MKVTHDVLHVAQELIGTVQVLKIDVKLACANIGLIAAATVLTSEAQCLQALAHVVALHFEVSKCIRV